MTDKFIWTEDDIVIEKPTISIKGGPGSGHYGHAGRPGQRGGSVPGGVALSVASGRDSAYRQRFAAGKLQVGDEFLIPNRKGGYQKGKIVRLDDPTGRNDIGVQWEDGKTEWLRSEPFYELTEPVVDLRYAASQTQVTVWHATHDEYLQDIHELGLMRGREWMGRNPSVYYMTDKNEAVTLGINFIGFDRKASVRSGEGPGTSTILPGQVRNIAIVEFSIPKSWAEKSIIDKRGNKDFKVNSARRIERDIPRSFLKKFSVIEFVGNEDDAEKLAEPVKRSEKWGGWWYHEEEPIVLSKEEEMVTGYHVVVFTNNSTTPPDLSITDFSAIKFIVIKGGPGSGHHGHAGRPGKRGGSLPGGTALSIAGGKSAVTRKTLREAGFSHADAEILLRNGVRVPLKSNVVTTRTQYERGLLTEREVIERLGGTPPKPAPPVISMNWPTERQIPDTKPFPTDTKIRPGRVTYNDDHLNQGQLEEQTEMLNRGVANLPQEHVSYVGKWEVGFPHPYGKDTTLGDCTDRGYIGGNFGSSRVRLFQTQDGQTQKWAQDTITHEVGHAVHNAFSERSGRQFEAVLRVQGLYEQLGKSAPGGMPAMKDNSRTRNQILPGLPTAYAGKNWKELWAESYEMYVHAPWTLKDRNMTLYTTMRDDVFNGIRYDVDQITLEE